MIVHLEHMQNSEVSFRYLKFQCAIELHCFSCQSVTNFCISLTSTVSSRASKWVSLVPIQGRSVHSTLTVLRRPRNHFAKENDGMTWMAVTLMFLSGVLFNVMNFSRCKILVLKSRWQGYMEVQIIGFPKDQPGIVFYHGCLYLCNLYV